MRSLSYFTACAVCGIAVAAEPPASQEVSVPGEAETPVAARVQLKPTQGHRANGLLSFSSDGKGVRIGGTIKGLQPNAEHGFHIHEKGDCSAPDASSAGGHYNPDGHPHGKPLQGQPHHLGDLVNLRADAKGVANVDAFIENATLHTSEASNVVGKAVVVHQKPDDYRSQPSGDSGDRIACGVIGSR
jgi:Cu-Zn family superoxide dismutase